jgi:hypothetical protein
MTAAAIARIVSTPLAAGAIATGAKAGRGLGGAAVRGAEEGAAAPARGGLGACVGAALLKTGAGADGPALVGGSVGNLIVGAAEGLGGRLMRTVSFLGWTFPVSFFGGTAPPGMLGMFSAIKLFQCKLKLRPAGVKLFMG